MFVALIITLEIAYIVEASVLSLSVSVSHTNSYTYFSMRIRFCSFVRE